MVSLDLGLATRTAILLELLEREYARDVTGKSKLKPLGRLRQDLARLTDAMAPGYHSDLIRNLQNAASWNSPKRELIRQSPYLNEAFAELVFRRLRGPRDLGELTSWEIFVQEVSGERAIRDFIDRMTGYPQQVFSISKPRISIVTNGGEEVKIARRKFLRDLESTLHSSLHSPRCRVVNVYAQDQWVGLSAVSHEAGQLKNPDGSRLPWAVCHTAPKSQEGRHSPNSVPLILSALLAFYRQKSPDNIAPPVTQREVNAAIDEIRKGMCSRAALIIIDGVSVEATSLPSTISLIKDNDCLQLVERLLNPPSRNLLTPNQWNTFHQCRYLITSNKPLQMPRGLVKSLPWPVQSDETTWREVLPQLGITNDDVAVLYEAAPKFWQVGSENLARILDVSLNVSRSVCQGLRQPSDSDYEESRAQIELLLKIQEKRIDTSDPIAEVARSKACIVKWVWKMLEHRPLWRLFLMLVAISPSGIRPQSLAHISREWIQWTPKIKAFEQLDAIKSTSLDTEIESFRRTFSGVVGRRRYDLVAGYDDEAHPFSFPVGSETFQTSPFKSEHEKKETYALDFLSPEFGRYVIDCAVEDNGYLVCRYAHRLIAEESLRQYNVANRHVSYRDSSSVRGSRRLIEALYHGYLSLPSTSEIAEKTCDLYIPYAFIPWDPDQAWDYLTTYCYANLLEQGNHYRLSRMFGRDEIKSELLQLMADPVSFREITADEQALVDTTPSYIQRSPLAEDLKISRVQAAYTAGRLDDPELRGLLDEPDLPMLDNTSFKRFVDLALENAGRLKTRPTGVRTTEALPFNRIRELCKNRLSDRLPDGIGFSGLGEGISQYLYKLEAVLQGINFSSNIEVLGHLHAQSLQLLDLVSSTTGAITLGATSHVVDILNRYAESLALQADLDFGKHKVNSETGRTEVPIVDEESFQQEYESKMLSAFAWAKLAEAFFDGNRSRNSTNSESKLSGHAARQMIRTSLRLENLARKHVSTTERTCGFFGQEARRTADRLCWHLHDYPRERASMLIIESSIARLLSSESNRRNALDLSLHYLADAEHIVEALDPKARLRLRFTLEKCKVHRNYVRHFDAIGKADDAKRSLVFAQSDLLKLEHLSRLHQSEFWRNMARLQRESLDQQRSQRDYSL
ncbi:MAG: hypothetical protein AAF662_10340 [Pseudomonadota bacterium]